MKVVVVDSDNAAEWVPQITKFGSDLDILARCSQQQVELGNLEATYPSEDLVQIFANVHDALALVLMDDFQVVGYVLSSADGYIKWAGIKPGYESHWGILIDLVRARYGQVWGRVSNARMRQDMIDAIDYVHVRDEDDPEVIGD